MPKYLLKRILVVAMLLLSLGVDCVYTIPPPPPPAVAVIPTCSYPGAVGSRAIGAGEDGGTVTFGSQVIGR